jgi:hypothetical protein
VEILEKTCMAHRRRTTKGLDTNEVKELNAAWYHAGRVGRPLNVMVTVRPIGVDEMSPADRCGLFSKIRNKLGVFARGKLLSSTFVWSREINLDGTGEHMHVLMHMPSRHRAKFDALVTGWLPGPAEADVTTANQKTRYTWDGRRLTAIGYVAKQMTPQAWYRRGMVRKAGGPIVGKRSGVTRDLDWRARDAFREAWATVKPPAFPPVRRLISQNLGR